MTNWQNIRKQFRAFDDSTYLNTAATGLIPDSTIEKVTELYQYHAKRGATAAEEWVPKMQEVREKVAKMIGASVEEIAIVPNMSIGMNWLAMMLKPMESIGFPEEDFPSLTSPWEIQGFKTQTVSNNENGEINFEEIRNLDTKIYANSHVQWHTGYKLDVEKISKICKEKEQIFILDATQSLGTCPINVREQGIDVLFASCYKWLISGFGNCVMYVKKELLEKYPAGFCWQYRAPEGLDFCPDAKRFEIGHERAEAFFRLGNSLDLMNEIGLENIEKRVAELYHYLYQQLAKNNIKTVFNYPEKNKSQIVIIEGKTDLMNKLATQNIFVSHRGTGLRISIHFYNNKEDIDLLIDAIKKNK